MHHKGVCLQRLADYDAMQCGANYAANVHVVMAVLFRLRCYAMLDIVRTVMLERVALNARIVDSTHRWLAAVRWVCWLEY